MSDKFYTSIGRDGEDGTSINRWITLDNILVKKSASILPGSVMFYVYDFVPSYSC